MSLALLAVWPGAGTAAAQSGGERPFPRLLAYAPVPGGTAGADYLTYSNLAELRRLSGGDRLRREDVIGPALPGEESSPAPSPRQAWRREVGRQVPISAFLNPGQGASWRELVGFDLFDVDYELAGGDPPRAFVVIEGAIDAQVTGQRLLAAGYGAAPSSLGPQAQAYARYEDYYIDARDPIGRLALSRFNRVVLRPRLLIAGPATDLVQEVVDAAAGSRPSLAADAPARLVASTMDDPALLPGSTLLGATLLSPAKAYELFGGGDLESILQLDPSDPEQVARLRERLRQPTADGLSLPLYQRLGIGYRRGGTAADRYWLFSLAYDDASAARQAAPVLADRIRVYRLNQTGQPLVGTLVAEVLPAVIREGPAGAAVSLALRLDEATNTSWLGLMGARDLDFLQPGPLGVAR